MGLRPIREVAEELGVPSEAWVPFGRSVAKIDPGLVLPRSGATLGAVVLVTGITPTALGVGKTVTVIGLASAMRHIGVNAIACLRQPSLGPVFGIKGGGAGGGRATVEPMSEVNLGLTGDLDAVTNAHNLLASAIDNHLHHGNALGIDPGSISWPRAIDLEDRALRDVEIGRGTGNGPVRRANFVITPASEVMAVLGLANGAPDLVARLDRLRVGRDRSGAIVRAGSLRVGGAMAALLRHARWPNLLQTNEGAPVLIHAGPFGNLSYATTSLAALSVARRLADVVLVEAGFATELGAEKFVDLVAPLGDHFPSTAVLVVSLPCLLAHSNPADGPPSMSAGLANFAKHVENLRCFGLEPVVAINRFPGDTPKDLAELRSTCRSLSVAAEESTGFEFGGCGDEAVARATLESLRSGRRARPIYGATDPLSTKVDRIVRLLYGGEGADFEDSGSLGEGIPAEEIPDTVPVCMAKTPRSLSDDPKRLGRPSGFRVRVRRLLPSDGAGYVVAFLGEIQTMPGLPREARLTRIGIDAAGEPTGVI